MWVGGREASTSLKCSHITIEPLISFTGKTIDNSQYLLPPAGNQGNPSDLTNTEQLPSKNIHSMGDGHLRLFRLTFGRCECSGLALLGQGTTFFKSCSLTLWLIWSFVLSCFSQEVHPKETFWLQTHLWSSVKKCVYDFQICQKNMSLNVILTLHFCQ